MYYVNTSWRNNMIYVQSFATPKYMRPERVGMKASPKTSPVTIKQVAEAAGVHFSTVSRALNLTTRSRVKPQITARILETAQRLGYRANTVASSLRTRRSQVIGVVVPDIASLLFPPILEGIESTLLKEGYMTIVANTANDPVRHRRILSGMIERQVDGLILATATLRDPILDEWLEGHAPIVLINRTDETGRAPAVINDDIRGIGLAVKHLAALGHRRMAHIAGPKWLSTGAMRQRGFQLAVSELSLSRSKPPIVHAEAFTREAGRAACLKLLDKHPTSRRSSPRTIFSRSDAMMQSRSETFLAPRTFPSPDTMTRRSSTWSILH